MGENSCSLQHDARKQGRTGHQGQLVAFKLKKNPDTSEATARGRKELGSTQTLTYCWLRAPSHPHPPRTELIEEVVDFTALSPMHKENKRPTCGALMTHRYRLCSPPPSQTELRGEKESKAHLLGKGGEGPEARLTGYGSQQAWTLPGYRSGVRGGGSLAWILSSSL